jgi:hypothetical protein
MFLYLSQNAFLLDLSLETTHGALDGFAFKNPNFSQKYASVICSRVVSIGLAEEKRACAALQLPKSARDVRIDTHCQNGYRGREVWKPTSNGQLTTTAHSSKRSSC